MFTPSVNDSTVFTSRRSGCCANLLDDKVNIFVRGVPGKPELCFPSRYNYDPRTQLL